MSGVATPDITDGTNKWIALLIATLALLLAFSEIGGKQAENDSLGKNIEASNLWSFFQAKTIRRSDTLIAAEAMLANMAAVPDANAKAVMQKQADAWRATAARLESEPDTKEGRKELMSRAKAAEAERDLSKQRNEKFEIASGILQIGIVIASAAIITGVTLLAVAGGGLGIIGIILMGLAQFAPTALF